MPRAWCVQVVISHRLRMRGEPWRGRTTGMLPSTPEIQDMFIKRVSAFSVPCERVTFSLGVSRRHSNFCWWSIKLSRVHASCCGWLWCTDHKVNMYISVTDFDSHNSSRGADHFLPAFHAFLAESNHRHASSTRSPKTETRGRM